MERLRAMCRPMAPRPIKPTRIFFGLIRLSNGRSGRGRNYRGSAIAGLRFVAGRAPTAHNGSAHVGQRKWAARVGPHGTSRTGQPAWASSSAHVAEEATSALLVY